MSTDLPVRASMAITALVAVVNGVVFFGWMAWLWWGMGLFPFVILSAIAFWLGNEANEPHRGTIACTLFLSVIAWPFAIAGLAFVTVAIAVIAMPRRRWRAWFLSPLALSIVVFAAIPDSVWWGKEFLMTGPAHATLIVHSVVLCTMVVDYAVRSSRVQASVNGSVHSPGTE